MTCGNILHIRPSPAKDGIRREPFQKDANINVMIPSRFLVALSSKGLACSHPSFRHSESAFAQVGAKSDEPPGNRVRMRLRRAQKASGDTEIALIPRCRIRYALALLVGMHRRRGPLHTQGPRILSARGFGCLRRGNSSPPGFAFPLRAPGTSASRKTQGSSQGRAGTDGSSL